MKVEIPQNGRFVPVSELASAAILRQLSVEMPLANAPMCSNISYGLGRRYDGSKAERLVRYISFATGWGLLALSYYFCWQFFF